MTDAAPSLRLHGYPVSNYFNTCRAAMIEKGLPGDFVPTRAGQDDAFLARSAMGKIPYLETPDGCLAETVAILDYLEDALPGPALLPADPFAQARVRQAVNILQVYVEVPLRALFPGTFMGGSNDPATVAASRTTIERAMRALGRLATFRPFLLGDAIGQADLFAFYTLDIGERIARFAWDGSLLATVPGLAAWHAAMADRRSSRIVLADFAAAFVPYLQDRNAAWREPAANERTVSHA